MLRLVLGIGAGDRRGRSDRTHHLVQVLGQVRALVQPSGQGVAKLGGRAVALLGVLAQGLAQDAEELGVDVIAVAVEAVQAGVSHHQERIQLARGHEQAPAHEQLGQHDRGREDVGPRVDLAPRHLLGRHVAGLALEQARARAVAALGGARDPEIDQLDLAGLRHEHVGRRDVAVHDGERLPVLVGAGVHVVERVEQLMHDVDADPGRQPPPHGRALAQHGQDVDAVDELHGDEVLALVLAKLVDPDEARMIELRGEPGLVEEHVDEVALAGQMRQQALDHRERRVVAGALGAGQEQLGHTADREVR